MIGKALTAGMKGAQIDRLLADLAFAAGNNDEALARYQNLLATDPANPFLLERAGIAALKVGDIPRAAPLLDRATAVRTASWRAWNARGVLADLQGDWAKADEAYDRSARMGAKHSEIINNQGWSQLLRGHWPEAVGYFEQAASLNPKSERITNNLELARAALASDLPMRRMNESEVDWAARLNDAGMAAEILGDRQRAVAAFTQALEVRGKWYERAANNLLAAGGSR